MLIYSVQFKNMEKQNETNHQTKYESTERN